MSDPATFQACTFRALSTTVQTGTNRVVVIGTMRWRLSPELPMPGYMTKWDDHGYKTAFNIIDAQTILAFSYEDVAGGTIDMIAAPEEIGEATSALGRQDGYHWVVFKCPPKPPRRPRAFTTLPQDIHTIEFTLRVTLGYRNPAHEVIGVATRLEKGRFAAGRMTLLWGIPPAPYPATG